MFEVLLFYEGEDKPSSNIKATEILFSSKNGQILEADFILPNASPEDCTKIELVSNFCLYLNGVGYRVKCKGIELTSNNNDYGYGLLAEISFIGFGEKCTCKNHISYMQNYKNEKNVIPEIINDDPEIIDDVPEETIDKANNKFELLDL